MSDSCDDGRRTLSDASCRVSHGLAALPLIEQAAHIRVNLLSVIYAQVCRTSSLQRGTANESTEGGKGGKNGSLEPEKHKLKDAGWVRLSSKVRERM